MRATCSRSALQKRLLGRPAFLRQGRQGGGRAAGHATGRRHACRTGRRSQAAWRRATALRRRLERHRLQRLDRPDFRRPLRRRRDNPLAALTGMVAALFRRLGGHGRHRSRRHRRPGDSLGLHVDPLPRPRGRGLLHPGRRGREARHRLWRRLRRVDSPLRCLHPLSRLRGDPLRRLRRPCRDRLHRGRRHPRPGRRVHPPSNSRVHLTRRFRCFRHHSVEAAPAPPGGRAPARVVRPSSAASLKPSAGAPPAVSAARAPPVSRPPAA